MAGGEQLEEAGRLPQAPLIALYGPSPHPNPEATEQPHSHRFELLVRWRPRSRYTFKASRRAHLLARQHELSGVEGLGGLSGPLELPDEYPRQTNQRGPSRTRRNLGVAVDHSGLCLGEERLQAAP